MKLQESPGPHPSHKLQLHPLMCLVFMIVGLGANKSGAYPENNANCTYSSYRVSVNAFCGIYFVLFFLSCVYHGVIIVMRVQWKGVIANNFHFFVRAVSCNNITSLITTHKAILLDYACFQCCCYTQIRNGLFAIIRPCVCFANFNMSTWGWFSSPL